MADDIDNIGTEDNSVDDALEEARNSSNPMPGQGVDGGVDPEADNMISDDPSEDTDVDPTEKYQETDDSDSDSNAA